MPPTKLKLLHFRIMEKHGNKSMIMIGVWLLCRDLLEFFKTDALKYVFVNFHLYRLLRSSTDISLISATALEIEMGQTSLISQASDSVYKWKQT